MATKATKKRTATKKRLWDDRSDGAPFWQIAYRTLYWLDMYSSASLTSFTPPAFHVRDAEFLAGNYPWLTPPRTINPPAFVFSKPLS